MDRHQKSSNAKRDESRDRVFLERAQAYLHSHQKGQQIAANLVAAWGDFFLVVDARLRRMMNSLKVPRNCREDVRQEVWAAITQKLHKFQSRQAFQVWLYKVARNKKADAIRHMARKRCESSEEIGKKLLDGKSVGGVAWLDSRERREWLAAQLSKEDPETVRLLLNDRARFSCAPVAT